MSQSTATRGTTAVHENHGTLPIIDSSEMNTKEGEALTEFTLFPKLAAGKPSFRSSLVSKLTEYQNSVLRYGNTRSRVRD